MILKIAVRMRKAYLRILRLIWVILKLEKNAFRLCDLFDSFLD